MPIYTFENTETNEVYDMLMKYDDKVAYLKNHPEIKERIGAPQIIGGTGDRVKTDSGFKEVLSKVADAHPGSELHSRHGQKDIKREKTLDIVKKHAKIQQKNKTI